MANTLLTPQMITREALRLLHNKLTFVGSINRQYDSSFAKEGAKIGSQLRIRKPVQFTVRTGATINIQDVIETETTITVATQKGIDFQFSSTELTLSIDAFSERYLEPAMARLAAEIEADVFNVVKEVFSQVGTPGTTPATLSVYLNARSRLNQFLAPKDNNRHVCINSDASAATVDALKGLFQDATQIAQQYKEGMLGRIAGFNFWENELIPVLTTGTRTGTIQVNGAGQTGSSLALKGLNANGTIKAGEVFTIANVYAVHPETKQPYPFLQQFVVTEDATADGSGNVTVSISPSIITSGAYQTVSAGPANNAAVTFAGSASTAYPLNIAYHKDAFTFVTADLELPQGVHFAARETYDGISLRIIRDYSISNDTFPCRIDVLYGYKCIRPELACRIIG